MTTARRDQIFEAMADAALAVAAAAANLAQDRGDTELLRATRVAPSEFGVPRRSRRVWLARRVHDAALGALEHLVPYGVTPVPVPVPVPVTPPAAPPPVSQGA